MGLRYRISGHQPYEGPEVNRYYHHRFGPLHRIPDANGSFGLNIC